MNPTHTARFANIAAVCGILSPVSWFVGIIVAAIYGNMASTSVLGGGVEPVLLVTCAIVFISAFGPPLVATIAGKAARRQIEQSRGALTGKGRATAGLVLGYGTIAVLITIVATFFVLNLANPEGMHQWAKRQLTGPGTYP